jgi:site-specific recombinase XerD
VFKGRLSAKHTATDRPPAAMSPRAVLKVIKRTAARAALPDNVKAMVSPHWVRHAPALDNGAPGRDATCGGARRVRRA